MARSQILVTFSGLGMDCQNRQSPTGSAASAAFVRSLVLEKPDGLPKRCFPHMFRDTFAVEMLLAGLPIDQVSILLGHKSVKIIEKHYAPWVKARQDQLASSVRNAWQLLDEPKATKPKRARNSARPLPTLAYSNQNALSNA
jgi:integrase/recombinase XerD